ncbi:MAG: zinc-dependent dehydrogenase [Candidatus Omnitrophota bacterium]
MRVATYYSNNDLRIEEAPLPEIAPGELLLRVEASGICGSDVIEWYRRDKTPLVLGHEVAGTIAEVGRGVRGFKKGQRISASHHVPCGNCYYCARGHQTTCETLRQTKFYPGGFAQFVRLPAINIKLGGVYPLPQGLSDEEATFTEPLACVLRAQRLAQVKKGASVLILGGGISGMLHLLLARYFGAELIVVTDIVPFRLDFARKLGAHAVINAKEEDVAKRFHQLHQGKGADLVIVATGARSAQIQALEAVERGGTVLFFAATDEGVTIPLSINEVFWRNETTLLSSYAATPQEHRQAITVLGQGKIKVKELITHRLGLGQIQEGFRLVAEARDSMKVIIYPQK